MSHHTLAGALFAIAAGLLIVQWVLNVADKAIVRLELLAAAVFVAGLGWTLL